MKGTQLHLRRRRGAQLHLHLRHAPAVRWELTDYVATHGLGLGRGDWQSLHVKGPCPIVKSTCSANELREVGSQVAVLCLELSNIFITLVQLMAMPRLLRLLNAFQTRRPSSHVEGSCCCCSASAKGARGCSIARESLQSCCQVEAIEARRHA